MTKQNATQQAAGLLDDLFIAVNRLGIRREAQDKWVAGVCSGVARRFGVDPVVVRVGLIVLILLSGVGILAYGLAWLLIPAPDGPGPLEAAAARGTNPLLVAGALLIVGGMAAMAFVGSLVDGQRGFFWSGWILPLVIVGAIYYHRRSRGAPPVAGPEAPSDRLPVAYPPQPPSDRSPVAYPPQPYGQSIPAGTPPPPSWAAPGDAPIPAGTPVPTGTKTIAPPRPKRARAGFFTLVLALGAAVAAYGIVIAGSTELEQTKALAAALGVVAFILIVVGLSGRRGGLTTLLAIMLAAATGLSAVSGPGVSWGSGIGERVWTPVASANHAFELGLGDATLDLSRLTPGTSADPTLASAELGVGSLTIRVPAGATVRVTGHVRYGDLVVGERPPGDSDGGKDLHLDQTFGSGAPTVVVDADVNLGELTVEVVR